MSDGTVVPDHVRVRLRARTPVLAPLAGLAALLGAAAVMGGTAGVMGQTPGSIVTDRPDQTESAESVPAGFVQLELGWTFARTQNVVQAQENHSLPQMLLRMGLGHGLEARVGFSGFVFEERSAPGVSGENTGGSGESTRVSGAGDAEIGLKLEVARWAGGQIALLGGVSLPVGRDEFSSQRVDPSFGVLVAHPLGERLSLGYNVGLAWATESNMACCLDTGIAAPYTLSLGLGLTDRLGAFVESFGAFGLSDGGGAVHSADGGFTFLVSRALQVDINAGVGLNETAEDWFIGGGFAFRLPR